MQVLLGALIAITGIFLVFFCRSLTTFFHEMGHALPALAFSKGEVKVFIGTYGDISHGVQLNLGRLKVFFRLNLFDWKIGMCEHKGNTNVWQTLLIIIGGPIMSLLISIPLVFWMIYGDLSEIWISILAIFVMAAAIDFFVNIIPWSREIQMYDGTVSYNDGLQIRLLIARMFLSNEYLALEEKYQKEEFDTVIKEGQKAVEEGSKDRSIFHLLLVTLMQQKRYDDALMTYQDYHNHYKLRDEDYATLVEIYLGLNNYHEALKCLDHLLYRNYSDLNLLRQRANVRIIMGDYREALLDLNSIVYYAPRDAQFLAMRGMVQAKIGDFGAAEEDLHQAQGIAHQNPYVAYYFGSYYEEKRDWNKALESYRRAKTLGLNVHGLDYTIDKLEKEL